MITKGQQLLKRYNKRTHIDPIQKDSILLFGEQVPINEFYRQYPSKKALPKHFNVSTFPSFHILKDILREYATPIFDLYSKKI
ncbi:MAG: hypothetical protein WCI00_06000 [bacterium]